MKKPRRRVVKNYALRQELINKGFVTPIHQLAKRLKERGYLEASKAVAERLARGLPVYTR